MPMHMHMWLRLLIWKDTQQLAAHSSRIFMATAGLGQGSGGSSSSSALIMHERTL
jgi:hypothetical protein